MAKHKFMLLAILLAATSFIIFDFLSGEPGKNFRNSVQDQLRTKSGIIDLSTLMGDEWEMVCNSHGYDGPIRLSKYDKIYQPVGAPQDGSWGLIFIRKGGAFESVTGSCKQGFDFDFGCLERGNTKLIYANQDRACITLIQAQP